MQSDTPQVNLTAEPRISGFGLFPTAIVALGSSNEPAPRLLAVQSAVARGIAMLAAFRLSSLHLPRPAWLRPRAQ
jgi:hypothetical protein